jgi:branched-chain amino acid transport system substrate-binding protein
MVLAWSAGCNPPAEDASKGTGESPTGSSSTSTSGAKRPAPSAEGNSATGETIKIGLVAAQSGDQVPWGLDSVKGAQLAVDEANAAGGVNGKQIELLIGDSQSKPESGKSAAEKLIADGVLGILGEVASGTTAQIQNSAFEKGIPVISVGSTRTDLADTGTNFFRVCYTDDLQGPAMAVFAFRDLNLRKVAVMTDQKQPYSIGLSESFVKKFKELGGEIVGEEKYQSGDTDFKGQLTRLKSLNPDGLLCSGYFNEAGPIARQSKELGLNVKLLGGDGWDSSEILQSGGDAIVGGFFCNHYSNLETERPEVKAFLDAWQAKHGGTPGTTMGALAYDAAKLMIDALKRATAPNSKELITAIEATENFPGVAGAITLKGMGGNPPKRALVVELTREGQKPAKSIEASDIQ